MLKLAPPSRQNSFPLRQRYTWDQPEAQGAQPAGPGLAGSPASQWHTTGSPRDSGDGGSLTWRIPARGAAGDTGSQWHMPGEPGHHLLDNPTWEPESAEVHLQLLPAEAGAANDAGQAPPVQDQLWDADMGSPTETAQGDPDGAELPPLVGAMSLVPLTRLQSRLSGLALWQAAGAVPLAAEAEPEAGAQPAGGAQPARELLRAASQARLQRYSRRLSQRLRELGAAQQALAGQQQGSASADYLLDAWQHWAAPVDLPSMATQQGNGQPGAQALQYVEGGQHPASGHVAAPMLGMQVKPLSLARQPPGGSGVLREASQQLLGAQAHSDGPQAEAAKKRLTRPSPAHAGDHPLQNGCEMIDAHKLRHCAGVCSCIASVCWAAWPSDAALHATLFC